MQPKTFFTVCALAGAALAAPVNEAADNCSSASLYRTTSAPTHHHPSSSKAPIYSSSSAPIYSSAGPMYSSHSIPALSSAPISSSISSPFSRHNSASHHSSSAPAPTSTSYSPAPTNFPVQQCGNDQVVSCCNGGLLSDLLSALGGECELPILGQQCGGNQVFCCGADQNGLINIGSICLAITL